jgi:serine/threonine protein kinase
MRDLELFTLASADFFESLSRLPRDPVYRNQIQELLPPDWALKPFDLWLLAHPPDYPWIDQGFKIHLSATRRNAQRLLASVIPECVAMNLAFKVAADPTLLSLMNCKSFDRGSSGKFFVVYPPAPEIFKNTLARLHELTAREEGPFILSDRRYPGSKIVHYRFGGFRHLTKIDLSGRSVPCIKTPEGRLEPDRRLPYFHLPPWIADPFPQGVTADLQEPEHLLHGRYRIEAALTFSNTGGVYLAVDTRTERKVIVKEARPLTHFVPLGSGHDYLDAARLLAREHRVLHQLRDCPGVVRSLDFFQEWEHFYLVEEFIDAIPLTNYRAREDFIVITLTHDETRVDRFCDKFRRLASQLLDILTAVHSRGILLGDVSPNNFMVDPETLAVTLIDVETAVSPGAPERGDEVVRTWTTAGFRKSDRRAGKPLSPEDDMFSLGMVLYSLLVPIQQFFEIEPAAKDRFINEIARTLGVPREVKGTIFLLLGNRPLEAHRLLDSWLPPRSSPALARGTRRNPWEAWSQSHRDRIAARVASILPRIAAFLLATFDDQRQDRLWPADVMVFNTNPLSLAAGACGPLLFLAYTGHAIPPEVRRWLLARPLAVDTYPPGLYWGLAGVAYTLAELGFEAAALKALDLANYSPLRFEGADMIYGAAGWGWTNLWFHARLGAPTFLGQARAAGEHLLASAETRGEGCCWPNSLDGLIHYGFGHGASGVALFLLYLNQATGDQRYLDLARRALDFELGSAIEPADAALKWRNHEQATLIAEPYLEHGSAGIGSVFTRFALALRDIRYLEVATRAGEFAFSKYAVEPTQFSGLSGIGEFMLDLFRASGQEVYLNRAYAIADSILMYAVERPQGVAFPGRLLMRLSSDFATGSAGVGLFLHRLLGLGDRPFLDLPGLVAGAAEPAASTSGDLAR